MDMKLSTVFVSHGPPSLVLQENPAKKFLSGLGRILGKPRAVLCVSAHWETQKPVVSTARTPETVHDFFGFPKALYDIRYPAAGAPDLADQVMELMSKSGMHCAPDPHRGLDHGAWIPLMLMYPDADVPVTQLSIQPDASPADHLAVGRALTPLCEQGVLVLGSGGAVHNLSQFEPGSLDVPAWALRFDDWLADVLEAGDADELANRWIQGPDGQTAHPHDEHLLPLPVAMGAAGAHAKGRALHRGFMDGALGMAAYAFESS